MKVATHNGINVPVLVLPKGLLEWLMLPFIVGLMTLSHVEGLSRLMVLFGGGLSFLFGLNFIYFKMRFQPEVLVFWVWICWSLIGAQHAADLSLYWQTFITIAQIGMMIFVVAGICGLYGNISLAFFAMVSGGLIVAFSSYFSGDFQLAAAIDSTNRAAGLTRNANSFAYHLLFVIVAATYFWRHNVSRLGNIFFVLLAALAFLGIIYSGSRKGFLGALVYILLWFLYCYGKKFFTNSFTTLAKFIIISGVICYTVYFVLSDTYLGERFEYASEHGAPTRVQMYLEGFDMISSFPISGVGLDNYRVHSSSGLYSHSEYIEVAATTGLVGFILYFSIYILLWRRLRRIQNITDDSRLLHTIGLLKAAIITILLIALGRPNITSKLTWIFLAAAIGYSWFVEQTFSSIDKLERRNSIR